MSKLRKRTGSTCMICDEKICSDGSSAVVLHKTRRQVHALCIECIQGYLTGPLIIMTNNIRRNIRKNITMFKCPGNYHGLKRNQCSHNVDILSLKIPEVLQIHTDIFRIGYIMKSPIAFLCPNKKCCNVVDVDVLYASNSLTCAYCDTNWCRQCLISPYHENKTCLEYEVDNQQGDNAKFIHEMNRQGKVKFCPTCKSPIFRDGGCNKMHCESCDTKFCWLCKVTDIDYSHYSEGVCSQKLWEGTDSNE